jgi:hypothetical protein
MILMAVGSAGRWEVGEGVLRLLRSALEKIVSSSAEWRASSAS